MRISRIALFLVLPIVAAAALIFFVLHRSNPTEFKLADGSIVRLERVSYGKRDKFMPREGWLRRLNDELLAHLPAKWTSRFINPSRNSSSWWNNTVVHTNSDALHIWVTRRDALTGKYLDVKMNSAQLVDEHGCRFIAAQCGGDNNGIVTNGYCVGWFTFEAFPRHDRSLRLQLVDNYGNIHACEFKLANPAPPPKEASDWTVDPLPIAKGDADVAFILSSVATKTNYDNFKASEFRYGNPYEIAPVFDVREHGQPSHEWEAVDVDLWDSSGNFASEMRGDSRFLCPKEKAWKLAVRFFGSEKSVSASNAVWTLHDLKVPGPGEFTNLNATKELQGIKLTAVSLAGAGKVTYSSNVLVQALRIEDPKEDNSFNNYSSGGMNSYNLTANVPHIAVIIGKMSSDQRLTIRATDDRGREFYAQEWAWGSYKRHSAKVSELHYLKLYESYGLTFFTLDLADDSKTIDLTFCIHQARTAEFIFKPPSNDAQPTNVKQP